MRPHDFWNPQHRPPWWRNEPRKRRFLFRRFATIFIPIVTIFLIGLVTVLALVFEDLQKAIPSTSVLVLVICGMPLGFILLSVITGGMAYRRVVPPVADVMAAADAVAEGDLSVRVKENIPGEFGRLARSFNRMASELERAEQQRRNLTADVAHELRTPLHIIQGNLEGIIDGVYQPTHEHISATLEETRLLSRLVEDLQTLSLAEAGQLPLHKELLSAADLVSDVATSFNGPAAEAGVELKTDISGSEADLRIEGDPDRLEQVLANLVSNALRYTPQGGTITLRAAGDGESVRLMVQDTGSGIPPEDLPFIFDRFWRGDRARPRQPAGSSGLGLAIARQLVQAHGGQIHAESQPGQGTLFTIELPLAGRRDEK